MAICDSQNKKHCGIPSLLGLAYNIPEFEGITCSLIDAKNDNVYCGIFDSKKDLLQPYFSDNIDNTIDIIKSFQKPALFIGDGAIAFKDRLKEKILSCEFAEENANLTHASGIAKAAFYKKDIYSNLSPLYLRQSQAERMMK